MSKIKEVSSSLDRSNRHSSSLLLRFAHQKPMISGKGATTTATVNVEYPEAHYPAEHPEGDHDCHKKLYRSTSACLFSSTKPSEKNLKACSSGKGHQEKPCHHAIQRSFSLEVPYANTGISCHVSNPKLSSPCSPHVHIHLSPCCPAKLPTSLPDINTGNKWNNTPISSDQCAEVSFLNGRSQALYLIVYREDNSCQISIFFLVYVTQQGSGKHVKVKNKVDSLKCC